MKGRIAVSLKTLSTMMVLLVCFFVLVYTGTTALRAPVIIAAFIWTLLRRGTRIRLRDLPIAHMLWALSIWILVLVSRMWAVFPQGIDDVKNNVLWCAMITIIMADYIVYYNVSMEELARLFFPIACLFILSTVIWGVRDNNNRLNISNNANSFGKIAIGIMSIYLYQAFKNKNRLSAIIAIVFLIMGLLSGSRKTIISAVVYFVCFFQFMVPNRNTKKALIRVLSVVILTVIFYSLIMNVGVLYNTIGNRIESLLGFLFRQEEGDASVVTRLNMIKLAMDIIKSNPVIGIGANNYKYNTIYNTYSHNGYLEIMCSFGIIGVIVYYFPLLKTLFFCIKKWRYKAENAIFPISVLLSFFVTELSGVSYFTSSNYCFLGVGIGIAFCIKKMKTRNYIKEPVAR